MTGVKKTAKNTEPAAAPSGRAGGLRETIESIIIAFVLAFLFRTFEAEAFVIPTGSMATTLLGRHLDIECDQCGTPFTIGDGESGTSTQTALCPNCGFTRRYAPAIGDRPPSYSGDRIIVTKFNYDFQDPQRWDVAVFKYPLRGSTNFIKRLVGVPNETLLIRRGNIFTRPLDDNAAPFVIQRKPPDKVLAMLRMVYDNDYALPWIHERRWPLRFRPDPPELWKASEDLRQFSVDAPADQTAWLRYQHTIPSPQDWESLAQGPLPDFRVRQLQPEFIKDGLAYNGGDGVAEMVWGRDYVGELAVEAELTSESDSGEVILQLIQANRRFECSIDLATGRATLSADDVANFAPAADTPVKGRGTWDIRLANIDDQLLLWVNDRVIDFGAGAARYTLPEDRNPGPLDREPVNIGVRGARVRLDHLRVLRDVFYIADQHRYQAGPEILDNTGGVQFDLGPDEFLALGDNSARSKDSRLWPDMRWRDNEPPWAVRRDMLIGKALFIYWPHALNHLPGTSIWVPLFPNVGRMRFVR